MRRYLILFFTFLATYSFGQKNSETNIILIGTYHFNNPGFDEGKVKERSILSQESQDALERITDELIKKHKPTKVFVEYDFAKANELNKMYGLYKVGKPFYNIDTLDSFHKRFYVENEIFQFGFRLAHKAQNNAIYSIDYDKVPVRFDLIKSKLEANSEFDYSDYVANIKELENFMNKCIGSNSLEDVFKCLNSPQQYSLNRGLYLSFLNRLNTETDFFGSDLVSLWYKRNLIMYANVQNQTDGNDRNIVIIVGAGHAAMFEELIKADQRFNLIRIDQIF